MTIRRIGSFSAILLFCCCSVPLLGKEQHLRFDTETETYELVFDDQLVPYSDIERIVWLCPLIDPTVPGAPFMTGIQRLVPGKIEKLVIALPLETCMPGYTECMHSTLNEAFLRNAAEVLKKTRGQLKFLTEEHLPAVLQPVRSYLLFTLQSTLDWKEAEYAYLRDSNMEIVREQFCKYCSCSGKADLLERMAEEKDSAKRLKLATYNFENSLVDCFAAHDPGYPIQVWKDFLKQYNIKEVWTPKWVP